jgi:lipopolysaccharide cholinephosphotransferase
MQTFKSEMNKSLSKYQVGPEATAHLKKLILAILEDVGKAADSIHVPYYLAYGSLLGAVRHKGYIPWDDDIDIWMKSTDIPALLQQIQVQFPGKYFFSGLGFGKSDDPVHVVKIMLSGTEQIEIQKVNAPGDKGIFIDIMPIMNTRKTRIGRYLNGKHYVLLYHICAVVYDYKYPSPLLMEVAKENKGFRKYYRFRRFLGFLFSIRSLHSWIAKQRRFIFKKYRHSNHLAVDGVGFFYPTPLVESDFEQVLYPFEEYQLPSIKNYDRFLTEIYGPTYMTPPQPGDREIHLCYKIDFGKY